MTLLKRNLWLFGLLYLLLVAALYSLAHLSLPGLLVLLVAGAVLGGGLGWLLTRRLRARLAQLSAEVTQIGAEVNFEGRVAVGDADEIGQLGQTLNQTLARLGHAHALLQATFESTDAGFLTIDATGRPLSANRQFFALWGVSEKALNAAAAGQVIGRTWDCRDITPRKQAEAAASRQMGELITVRDIAFAGSEVTTEEELAELTTKIIGANLYPLDIFNIGLVDLTTGALRVLSSHYVRGDIAGVVLPPGRGITGRAVATGQTQIVPDITQDPAYVQINSDTRSEICVPIKAGRRAIGFLNVESAQPAAFGEADERLLAILAGQLATALEKVRMSSEVQRLAITDALTGLYNRRHFFLMAQRELDRARRHERPLSVIMLDLDHFKRVNDTYGHAAGDLALKTVADYCHKGLRGTDLLGRYGGEEFVFLLGETSQAKAQEVAERLRLGIAALAMPVAGHTLSITASLGLATLDDTQPGLDKLLDCADQALYHAKAAGRNCVCVWSGVQALCGEPGASR
jgi:diguanylate cyclase (GGDEF)-like protein